MPCTDRAAQRARRRGASLLSSLLLALASTATAAAAPTANDYAAADNWLCRPGRADSCGRPTTTTVVDADGGRRVETLAPDPAAAIDCFYVYPTVSREPAPNSDMAPTGIEEATTIAQFAPFASRCRPFAPRYRQVTVAGLRAAMSGGPRPDVELAYRDVLDAWHHYLEHDNQGRGVVLVGHSQGSKILARLIAEEIDGRPLQSRFVSAIIPGTLVEVPLRADAGGTYAHIALCTKASDLGCVVAYSSYLATDVAVPGAVFGVAEAPGRIAGCVNPAQLTGSTYLEPAFPSRLSPGLGIDTTFIDAAGVVQAECVTRGAQTFLAIEVVGSARASTVAEGLKSLQSRRASWGLHLLDMNLAMGNLLEVVAAQSQAWMKRAGSNAAVSPRRIP